MKAAPGSQWAWTTSGLAAVNRRRIAGRLRPRITVTGMPAAGRPDSGSAPPVSPATTTSRPRSRIASARCSTWGLLTGPRSSSRTGAQPSLRAVSANGDVTVVIPCFESGAFVGEAVASALAQEDGPPRVVVVDDGSTGPATLTALDELPAGARVLRQANAGVAD